MTNRLNDSFHWCFCYFGSCVSWPCDKLDVYLPVGWLSVGRLVHAMLEEQQTLDHLTFTHAQVKGFREIFVENVLLARLHPFAAQGASEGRCCTAASVAGRRWQGFDDFSNCGFSLEQSCPLGRSQSFALRVKGQTKLAACDITKCRINHPTKQQAIS